MTDKFVDAALAREGTAFVNYIDDLRLRYEHSQPLLISEIQTYIQTIRLLPNQFLYIHDIPSGRFFHKGFNDCLGYQLDELTADFFVRNIHPADRSTYFNVSKAMLAFVIQHAPDLIPFVTTFQINYRVRKQDGNYISILRQNTPFIKNENNNVQAYISLCTDISLISDSTRMKWTIGGPKKELFPQFLEAHLRSQHPLFSDREKHILQLLGRGLSSSAISEQLFISTNTVNTHRKSLMKKANVNKTIDLIAYARENGYM